MVAARVILTVAMICIAAASATIATANPSRVTPSAAMLSGGGKPLDLAPRSLSLGSSRVAYLRFSVPAAWTGSSILLRLTAARKTSGLTVRPVIATWKRGKATRIAPLKALAAVSSGRIAARGQRSLDLSTILTAGKSYTVRLSAVSGAAKLSRLPYLARLAPAAPTAPAPSDPTPTAPAPTTPAPSIPATGAVNVVAAGDIACRPADAAWNGGLGTDGACRQSAVSNLVLPTDAAVLTLGDNQYPAGAMADFQSGFGSSWGGLASRLRPAPGNHEYYTAGAAGYFDYFGSIGVAAGDRAKGYYATDVGSWRLLSMNSNCTEVSCSAGSAQEQWLRAELSAARTAGKCTLAYWHHPRASSGEHGDNLSVDALWRALHQLGGDVVLAGHDHNYERFDPLGADATPASDGPRSFVVGTGGRSHYTVTARAGSAKTIAGTFGLLRLGLSAGSYSWQWSGVAGVGSDSGAASCR